MSERFGPYELVRLLGRGGMGEVHAALDTEQDRPVALKRLLSHLADDEEFQKRFRRESRTAARLASPHVIPIHRSGEIDGQLFIDMRLVEGLDLDQLLARDAHLAPARVVAVIEQVASALDAAHHAGLIHRDVKPSNVLLDTAVGANDFVYLVDFGITRPFGEESQALTSTHAVVGSLDYMAPEQFDGVADPSIDIYSLGCLLYQTLTGSRPFPLEGFPALMRAHLSLPAPAPSVQRPALGTAFDEVVAVALAKDPRDRYASAGALGVAARAALETATAAGTDRWTDPTPRPAGPTERAPTPRRPVPSRSGARTGPPPRALSPAHDPATSLVRATPEPVTGTMAPQHAPDPVTTAMPPRSAPPRPPAPPPGAPHPSFPYAAPPWPIEDEAVPEAYPDHAWEAYPEEDEAPPARSSVSRRLVLAVLLVVLLVVGVLAGRIVAAWATGGSPLGSLLGAGLELVASVPAPLGV